jgi:hypothetical protein
VLKIEKIDHPRLCAGFNSKHNRECERLGCNVNHQRCYHLSKAGWGHICESGLDIENSAEGLFGKGLYFSPDPKKCDDYWRRAAMGEAGAVAAASTGKDPATTRYMFCARVILGRPYEFAAGTYEKSLRAPPNGYDSVAGHIKGQRELVVYENSRVLLEYLVTYEVPEQFAAQQRQMYDEKQQQQRHRHQKAQQQHFDAGYCRQLKEEEQSGALDATSQHYWQRIDATKHYASLEGRDLRDLSGIARRVFRCMHWKRASDFRKLV